MDAIFGKNSVANFTDKLFFWIGLLIGYEIFAFVFFYSANIREFGEMAVMATNGKIVTLQLFTILIIIFAGHILFSLHAVLCAWIFGKTVLSAIAMPVYAISIFGLIGGAQITEDLSISGFAIATGFIIAISIILMLVLEFLIQQVFNFAIGAVQFFLPKQNPRH